MKKITFVLLILLFACFVVTGCGHQQPEKPKQKLEDLIYDQPEEHSFIIAATAQSKYFTNKDMLGTNKTFQIPAIKDELTTISYVAEAGNYYYAECGNLKITYSITTKSAVDINYSAYIDEKVNGDNGDKSYNKITYLSDSWVYDDSMTVKCFDNDVDEVQFPDHRLIFGVLDLGNLDLIEIKVDIFKAISDLTPEEKGILEELGGFMHTDLLKTLQGE